MAAWRGVCGVSVMLLATAAWAGDEEPARRGIGAAVKAEVREVGAGVRSFFQEFRVGFHAGRCSEPPVVVAVEEAPPGTVVWVGDEGVTIWVPE